jgi:hypothetical protein
MATIASTLSSLLLVAATSASHLSLEPWTGTNLPTTTRAALKYRLHVEGVPNSTFVLRADGVAKGWLAAFCTPKVCAPMRVDVTLPASGQAVYQFELIREAADAPARSGARITSSDGASVTLPP